MFKKTFLTLGLLFLTLESASAITKAEEAKITQRERTRLMAMRGNTFGIFGWDGFENLNLDSKKIFLGCLHKKGIVVMNDHYLENICRDIADNDDTPTCSEKKWAPFKKLKGNVVFVDAEGRVAPYFRPLTDEETRELYGNRVPVCSSYEFDFY